jgi:hypothetical protein
VPLPRLPPSGSGVVVLVSTTKTTALLAGGGETTALAVLVDGLDDPIDTRVAADGLVLRVDEDDFVVLVGRVLVDPVGVEDAEVSAAFADTLLSGGLERALVLELVDTLVGGLACLFVSLDLGSGITRVKHTVGGAPRDPSLAVSSIFNGRAVRTWERASCDLHGGHGSGRQRNPAWPCIRDGVPCRDARDGWRGG